MSKQIGIFNSYSNEGKTTVAQSRRGGPCGRRRCSSPPVEWAQPHRSWSLENTELCGMGLEVGFKVCVWRFPALPWPSLTGFTVCANRTPRLYGDIHYSCYWWTRVRLRPSARFQRRPSVGQTPQTHRKFCWKCSGSGKDTDVGLGYVNVEQDSANALGDLVPLIVPGWSRVARATRRWLKCGVHGL